MFLAALIGATGTSRAQPAEGSPPPAPPAPSPEAPPPALPPLAGPEAPPPALPPPAGPESGPIYPSRFAPRYAPDPTAHRHDGFYLRLLGGPGGFTTSASYEGNDLTIKGLGGGLSVAIGGALSRDVILYAEVLDDIALHPTLQIGHSSASADDDVSAGVVAVGPGLAHYFPSNAYLSATLALARLTANRNGEEVARSDYGFGVSAVAGKEWWVGSQWGLGVAGQLFLGTIPDGGIDARWTTVGFMIAVSATRN